MTAAHRGVGVASRGRRGVVVHVGPSLSPAAWSAQRAADERAGLAPELVPPEAPSPTHEDGGAQDPLEVELRRALRACADASGASVASAASSADAGRVDAVVAHGWAPVAAALGLARAAGAALVVAADPCPDAGGPLAELAAWGAAVAGLGVPAATAARPVPASAYAEAHARRDAAPGATPEAALPPARLYDVAVRADGLPLAVLEHLLGHLTRVVVAKGATPEAWARTCRRSRVALLAGTAAGASAAAAEARSSGCTPLALGAGLEGTPSVSAEGLLDSLRRALDAPLGAGVASVPAPGALAQAAVSVAARPPALRSPGPTRPVRVVLNHGGHVAAELAASLAPLGWELRPLLGPGRDPLPAADLLVALPYGDPRGALEAVRRARRLGVPAAFWNVEDPRYHLDPELGPLVQAAAREATLTFSTTRQLEAEYRALGVEVRYLPNYGRTSFLTAAPLPDEDRTVDVLFLGTLTAERRGFLEAFRAALGPEASVVARDDVRDPGAQRDLVARARLGLAVGTLTDAATPRGRLRGEGLTERAFDYPLTWTPVLHDARGHLADHFVPDQDLVVVHDPAHAAEAARRLLADPALRARLAASARRKVLAHHLGRHRLVSVVEALAAAPGAAPWLEAALAAARAAQGATLDAAGAIGTGGGS